MSADKVLDYIKANPGLRTSEIVKGIGASRDLIENAIWDLWVDGLIQIDNDSRIRLPRDGERIFRHII